MEPCAAELDAVCAFVWARALVGDFDQVTVNEDLDLQVFAMQNWHVFLVFLVETGAVNFEAQCEPIAEVTCKIIRLRAGLARICRGCCVLATSRHFCRVLATAIAVVIITLTVGVDLALLAACDALHWC